MDNGEGAVAELNDEVMNQKVYASAVNSPSMPARGLLISGYAFETMLRPLKEQNVRYILQVGKELRPSHGEPFKYLHIPIDDAEGADLISKLPEAFAFIDEGIKTGGNVLVHCAMGISRSASTIIAYLMWKQRLGFAEAASQVYAVREIISPNPGFVLQLRKWERSGMDFAQWKGWSRQRFLEALEEAGGIHHCTFEAVMREAGYALSTLSMSTPRGTPLVYPSPPAVRRPMPLTWRQRIDCVIS